MTKGKGAMTNKILGISGSLRKASLNTAALRAAKGLCPANMEIHISSIADVPLYNGDLDEGSGPAPVQALRQQVSDADGLLIATPEYNFSVPGVLKNAIDWASRPGYKSVLAGKPVAVIGVSPSGVGTARAQHELRDVLFGTMSEVFPHPEVLIGNASSRFDAEGQLTDEATRDFLTKMLARYGDWLRARAMTA